MAKKSQKMHFEWNYSKAAIVDRLGFGTDLNKVFAETLVKYSEPYTPYKPSANKPDNQHLRTNVEVRANNSRASITYPDLTYAQYQYFSDDSGWSRNTPGTTSRWLEYAWALHKPEISGTVGAYRRWHSK